MDRICDSPSALGLVLLSQTAADLCQVDDARSILSFDLLYGCAVVRLITDINEQLKIIIILNLNILIVIIIIIIDLSIWHVDLTVVRSLLAWVNTILLLPNILAFVFNIDDATLRPHLGLLVLVVLLVRELWCVHDAVMLVATLLILLGPLSLLLLSWHRNVDKLSAINIVFVANES